jgi:histone acetyltransferase (RNA polymerase elongator complex component)
LTLETQGRFDICPVCFWEDDAIQSDDAEYAGGANPVSLRDARENFREFGAAERRLAQHIRMPHAEEFPSIHSK